MNSALEAEIRSLEERLLDRQTRLDSKVLEQLLAEDFVEFGASGTTWTRATVITALPQECFVQRTLSDFQLRVLADDVVLATYCCKVPSDEGVARSLRSSIWRRCDGNWRMAFHQGTRTASIDETAKGNSA